MNLKLIFALAAGTLCVSGVAPAQTLDAAFSRMDKAAAGFKSVAADLNRVSYTALIKEKTTESGSIKIFRPKQNDTRMLVEFTQPETRAVAYQNKKVQLFYPKINTVQEYDMGKQASLIDQFLLLGFGTPSSDLKKSYAVKYLNEDTVEGQKSDHLELTPTNSEARQRVTRIEMWLNQSTGQPVQLQIFQPSKDYSLITYTNLKVNSGLTADAVALKLPKDVKKERPQR